MNTRLVVASLTTLAFVRTAAADEPAGDSAGTPAPDPAAPGPTATAPTSRYPRGIIDRVLTYPKGMFVVGGDLATKTSSFFDPATIRVLGGYGITDDFELNFAAYSFPSNSAADGSIDGGVGFKLLRGAVGGKLEVIARAQTGYSLLNSGMNPLLLGAQVQYNVTPKLALITPGPQLSIALSGDVKPITVNLPVSLGFQVTPTFYIQADTSIGSIKIKNSANVFFGSDVTPIFVAGYLNVIPAVDVYAGLGSSNLTPADPVSVSDTIFIGVGARYYGGM